MNQCDGCTTPLTCAAHGCAVPTEAQKLERAKDDAHGKLRAAEKAWYAYYGLCEVGPERTRAAEVYQNLRIATGSVKSDEPPSSM